MDQTESFISWSNAAKQENQELKKGSGRKFIQSGTPKRLYDDCLDFESYIRSNTAQSIYALAADVPETIMSRETSSKNQLCEFE